MKIAYLVLCHKNQEQVTKLIETLSDDNIDFFIHIDKKAIDFTLEKRNNIHILPFEKRIDVQWATKSMIDATIELIHFMLEYEKKYDYVFLISGQDFPIKTNAEIQKYLTENFGFNFIEILPHTNKLWKRYKKRNDLYYPRWMQKPSKIIKVVKKIYIYLSGGYNRTFRLFIRKNNVGINYEFGSQWWCLTYECLLWIINYIDSHRSVLDFFNNALTPDECLFQTVFMCSPYNKYQHDKLTYIEWDKNKNHPRIFTKNDYELLRTSNYLFARKFDSNIDKTIIILLSKI